MHKRQDCPAVSCPYLPPRGPRRGCSYSASTSTASSLPNALARGLPHSSILLMKIPMMKAYMYYYCQALLVCLLTTRPLPPRRRLPYTRPVAAPQLRPDSLRPIVVGRIVLVMLVGASRERSRWPPRLYSEGTRREQRSLPVARDI